jgi:hypothetical protein
VLISLAVRVRLFSRCGGRESGMASALEFVGRLLGLRYKRQDGVLMY